MTTPGGGGLGEAYVTLTADSSDFDDQLARQLRKIAKERGPAFGEQLASGMLRGFRKQLRADLPKYEAEGRKIGTALRRGFDGVKVGERMGQDVLRGLRAQLRNADIKVGGVSIDTPGGGSATGGVGGGAQRAAGGRALPLSTDVEKLQDKQRKEFQRLLAQRAKAQAKADKDLLAAQKKLGAMLAKEYDKRLSDQAKAAAQARAIEIKRQKDFDDQVTKVIRKALKDREKAEADAGAARDKNNAAKKKAGAFPGIPGGLGRLGGKAGRGPLDTFSKLLTGLGPGGGVGLKGLLTGLGALTALTPEIGSLFQALRDTGGALFGLLPALTAAGGFAAIFAGDNERLARSFEPVSVGFKKLQVDLDAITALAAQPGFRVLADDILPKIRVGLQAFAGSVGASITNIINSLQSIGAGESLSRAFTSIGQAFDALTGGPGLGQFFQLLLRINEQVSAALPAAFTRLQGFLNGLNQKFAATNFADLFNRGIQAIVDFGGAVINALRVLNAFFGAVRAGQPEGTAFASLRQFFDDLVTKINNNRVKIAQFVGAVRTGFVEALSIVKSFLGGFLGGFAAVDGKAANLSEQFRNIGEALRPLATGLGAVIGFLLAVAAAFADVDKKTIAVIIAIAGLAGGPVTAIAALVSIVLLFKDEITRLAFLIQGAFLGAIEKATNGIADLLEKGKNIPFLGQYAERAASGFRGLGEDAANAGALVDAAGRSLDKQENRVVRATFLVTTVYSNVNANSVGGQNAEQNQITDEKRIGREQRTAKKRENERNAQIERDLARSLGSIAPLPSSTSSGAGGGGAAAAAKEAVELSKLIEGLTDSLQAALPQGVDATTEAFKTMLRTLRDTLEGTLQEGATGAAQAALESMRSSALAAAASYTQISAAVELTTQKLADLKSEQESFRESVAATLRDAASIGTFLSNRRSGSAASFGGFLKRQIKALERFSLSLKTLIQKGLDPVLVRDLAAGGLDNERFARRLAEAPAGDLAALNALQQQVNTLAGGAADATAATFDAGIRRVETLLGEQLAQQKSQAAQLDALANNIVAGIAAAIQGKPLPKFAKGGITRGPSLAGEAGRELIVPLDRPNRRANELLERTIGKQGSAKYVNAGFTINAAPGQSPEAIAAAVDRRLASTVR